MKIRHSSPPVFLNVDEIRTYDQAVELARSHGVRVIFFLGRIPATKIPERRVVVTTWPKNLSDLFAFALTCSEAVEPQEDPPSERALKALWNTVKLLISVQASIDTKQFDEAVEGFLALPSDSGKPANKKELKKRRSDVQRMLSEYGLSSLKYAHTTK